MSNINRALIIDSLTKITSLKNMFSWVIICWLSLRVPLNASYSTIELRIVLLFNEVFGGTLGVKSTLHIKSIFTPNSFHFQHWELWSKVFLLFLKLSNRSLQNNEEKISNILTFILFCSISWFDLTSPWCIISIYIIFLFGVTSMCILLYLKISI
jgi:hypothetical protein